MAKDILKNMARINVHFSVGKAEAGGFRFFVERRGHPQQGQGGGRRIAILNTHWYPSLTEAEIGLRKERRRWTAKL